MGEKCVNTYVFIYFKSVFGGAETLIMRKAKWLREKGHFAVVITTFGPMVEKYKAVGAHVLCVDSSFLNIEKSSMINMFEFQNLIAELINDLQKFNNIVVIEGIDTSSGLVATWLSQLLGTRLLIGILHPSIFYELMKNYLNIWDKHNCIYSINFACYNEHELALGIRFSNKNIVPVGIDFEDRNNELRKGSIDLTNGCKILTIARLDREKLYIQGLIESFDNIERAYPGSELTIIGDGPCRKFLEKVANKSKYKQSIKFIGLVNPEELRKYYLGCHIYVGMGTTALYGAAYFKPTIIAYIDGGKNESPGFFSDLPDDSFGERIEGQRTYKFDDLVLALCEENQRYEQVAANCYTRVINTYGIDAVMRKWLDLINQPINIWDGKIVAKLNFNAEEAIKRNLRYSVKKYWHLLVQKYKKN